MLSQPLTDTHFPYRLSGEARLQGFFDVSTAGMVEVSLDALIIRADTAFCRMLGYPPLGMTGISIAEIVFPEDRDEVLAQYLQMAAGAKGFEADRRYRRKDGTAALGAGQRGVRCR